MEPTFKLIITGAQPGRDPQALRESLQGMLKGPAKEIEALVHRISIREQVVLTQNLAKEKAEKLLHKLTEQGLTARLEPMQLTLLPVEEEDGVVNEGYTCPACGHKQPLARDQMDTCQRCGVVGRNYEQYKEYKEALELERRYVKSQLAKENAEKAEAAKAKSGKKQEKLQQEMLERARRQAEKELNISPWHKYKLLIKPRIVLPVLGSMAVAALALTVLVWQLSEHKPDPIKSERDPGLQIIITPPPGTSVTVENPAEKLANAVSQGVAAAGANQQPGTTTPGNKETVANGAAAGANQQPSTTTPGNKETLANGAVAGTDKKDAATDATKSTGQPVAIPPLIAADKIALAKPTSARPAAVPTPQLLADLARYQAETGDEVGAEISLDRAIEMIRGSQPPTALLDGLIRQRIETLAMIARQYHQRQDSSAAQAKWYRAINLASTVTTPSERAQAFSGIARTLHDASTDTYFERAAENARAVNDPSAKVRVLSVLARDLASVGRTQQGAELFTQALALVDKVKDEKSRSIALGTIAKAHAEAGDSLAAANLLARMVSQPQQKSTVLPLELERQRIDAQSAMARHLVSGGNIPAAQAEFTTALSQMMQLENAEARAAARLYLAAQLAAAGDRESAAQLAADTLQPAVPGEGNKTARKQGQ